MTEDEKTLLKRMFPNHAARIDAANPQELERIEQTLALIVKSVSTLPTPLGHSILNIGATQRPESSTPIVANAIEALQKQWQKPLAVSAFSSILGLPQLLPKLSLKLPKIDLPIVKFPAIDWEKLYDRDEIALRFAAQNNWFIQPEAPYTITKDVEDCAGDVERLDQLMSEATSELKSEIRSRLLNDYPGRAAIIAEIFRLHDEQRYLASIPLAMLSAEGIALDVSKVSIFNRKKNRPEIAAWLDKQQLSNLAKAFLASLSESHPMSKGSNVERLSRHGVLHGRDTNYGSELFSLQAISLLGFVGWAFANDGLISDVNA